MNLLDDVRADDYTWADPALRRLLRSDPASALKSLGIHPPDDAPAEALIEAVKVLSMVWQDGRVVPKREFAMSPDDEGLLFGRGVWESARTFDGRPWLWDLHINRLLNTARILNIPLEPARLPVAPDVQRFVRGLTRMEVVVRLNVSAGSLGRPGTVWMSAAPPTPALPAIRLQTIPNPVPKDQPFLVWKTFQYATRLRVGRPTSPGFDSTLLVDADGRLLEAAHANLFIRFDGGWVTPTASQGGLLPGTVRHHILKRSPISVAEREVFRSELGDVREAFVTNSNVGLVPVTRIDDHVYPIGAETRRIGRWLLPDAAKG